MANVALPTDSVRPAAESPPEPAADPPRGLRRWTRNRWAHIRPGLPRTGLAALCGVLLALSFPPYGLWVLSVPAVTGLSLLTHRRTARQAAWSGLVFGAVFLGWLLVWLNVIGLDAWLILALFESVFVAAMAAGLALVSRLPGWPLWTACLWVTQEWARDRVPLGGFPWGRLAYANTSSPFTPLAAIGGAPLVSFAVALSGALLAAAVLVVFRQRGSGRWRERTLLWTALAT